MTQLCKENNLFKTKTKKKKMASRIRKKIGKNGTTLYLDTCYKGKRYYEFLDITLKNGNSPGDREHNKQMMNLAERVQSKRWDEILNQIHGLRPRGVSKVNFFEFSDELIKDLKVFTRGYTGVINKLKEFNNYKPLYPCDMTERFLSKFYDTLQLKLNGETPASYFKKLKRLIKEATKQNLFKQNPVADFKCRKFCITQKDTLTFDEIKVLLTARCPNEEVKRSFIFAFLTGLRWCDIKELKHSSIKGNKLDIIQKKTKLKVSVVLNVDALNLIGKLDKNDGFVFSLPSHTGCLKNLRVWLSNSEINKHITFHSARHSFGTNLISSGTDIYTTSKLLGHNSLKHTERYVRECVKLKEVAVNNLPKLF